MSIKDQLRIMVVDDTSVSRGLIMQALEALRIRQVMQASDGRGALQAIDRAPVHLVISDYNMPGMNGIELLRALRQGAKTRGCGFILITGRAEREIIEEGRKLGMNNFLKKPFTAQEMRDCLESVVGRL